MQNLIYSDTFDCISINKSPNLRIIISALQIVHPNFVIEVITPITERVNGGNVAVGDILGNGANAPSVVVIFGYNIAVLVGDGNDIALQVLVEVEGNTVVKNTANGVLVVIEGNNDVAIPLLAENLGAIKGIGVRDTIYSFACTNTVGIVVYSMLSVF